MLKQPIIRVQNLVKRYGAHEALNGVSFEVAAGEVFGVLGPNGSGKTTILEILEGLRTRSGGSVEVAGLDPSGAPVALKHKLSGQLQHTIIPGKLRVREIFDLFASFYPGLCDIERIQAFVGLQERLDAYFQNLSGGQQQRVALGLALLGDPEIIFLDEPTSGLDPQMRQGLHRLILSLKAEGRTILLTTHYIEEAERLCDRVAILVGGRIIAEGNPREMVDRGSELERLEVELEFSEDLSFYESLPGVVHCQIQGKMATLYISNATEAILHLVQALECSSNFLRRLQNVRPSLEDIYLGIVGGESK